MINYNHAALAVILVLLMPVLGVNAQSEPEEPLKKVEGLYVNPDAGIEVELPKDWSGFEMSLAFGSMETIMVAAAQGGIDPDALMDLMPEKPMMMLAILSMPVTEEMESTDNPPQLSQEGMDCTPASFRTVKVSDVDSLEAIIECTSNVDGKEVHAKGKTFFMNQESAEKTGSVTIMFAAPSDMYDATVNEFDESLKTLKVENASAFKLPMDDVSESFSVGDSGIDVRAESSSEISNLSFSEMDKSISFEVSGEHGTIGITVAYAGSIIKEPYVVTIDDKPANFEVVTDDKSGVSGVKLVYVQSGDVHNVTVAGSEVIPEFPVVAIALMGVMVAMTIAVSRFTRGSLSRAS